MTKIVYDANVMQMMSMFEQMTRAQVKDCVTGNPVLFIVQEGEIAKAIGKGGQHVRNLEKRLKKRVKVVEFSSDLAQFLKNLVAPLALSKVERDGEKLIIAAKDLKTRGLLIGRNASNLRQYEAIVQRYFPITEIRVE